MTLYVYNTLSRSKEEFVPLQGNTVRMYVCGPTVYDYPHIGNARSFAVFDTIRRYLEYKGYRVTFVTNITDIDDKMIARAREEGTTVRELAARFTEEYLRIARELNLKPATVNPRATEHIDDMIDMIQHIVDNGKAYVVDGDVYFDVAGHEQYGVLSRISKDELAAGARVEVDEKKRDPRDFALWKAEKPGEPSWESPWGRGRPGWHIECSAMGARFLGLPFDIHGGGQDLIFPHHENEIAQSSAAYNIDTPVKYWLHNGFLTIDKEKMSKSEGNFYTAREVLDRHDHQAVRLYLVSAHYRQPLDFNEAALEQAQHSLDRLRNAAELLRGRIRVLEKAGDRAKGSDRELKESVARLREGFERAMDDDFNTPSALAEIFTFVRDVNTLAPEVGSAGTLREALAALTEVVGVLGIDLSGGAQTVGAGAAALVEGLIGLLLEIREEARAAKDYATADRIRARLGELGVVVADTKDGPTWKIAR